MGLFDKLLKEGEKLIKEGEKLVKEVATEENKEKAKELFEESIKALDSLSCDTEILRAIAAFIITRVK